MPVTPFSTAAEILAELRSGKLCAVDLVEAQLERIGRINPELNAIVTLDAEGARQRAREIDASRDHWEATGRLGGLPITIKDAFETAGLRSTAGYQPLAENIPHEDASAVARLRQAGTIILGKTNLPPMASDFQTDNPIFGRTNNPWDLARTPGGSTGGGAAAVAAGLSFIELGSDLSGSLRIPAHFCGVYGFAPTDGRVPRAGHLPRQKPGNMTGHFLRVGLLARSVVDLRLAFSVIAGAHLAEPDLAPVEMHRLAPRELAHLRLAWTDTFDGAPVSAASRALLESFVQRLASLGAAVEQHLPSGFDFAQARGVHNRIFMSQLGAAMPAIPRFIARTLGRMQAFDLDLAQYLRAEQQRAALCSALDEFMGGLDAWICPVCCAPAIPHHAPSGYFGPTAYYKTPVMVDGAPVDYYTALSSFTIPFNVTGHPVVVIPIGQTPEGLPVGVQVVGRRWQDLELLQSAELLAQAAGPFTPPPAYALK